jgi:hypothetical protein
LADDGKQPMPKAGLGNRTLNTFRMIFISLRAPLTVANAKLLAARAELANLRPAAQVEQRALT